MISNPNSSDDRETLCALFDGELQGDAARFALKRLGHDAVWRETCGRWQLAGDVLRGQAGGVAPGGFAERVAQAATAEQVPSAEPAFAEALASAGGAKASRRGWIPGAALAASVAVAALFVTRPFSNEAMPDSPLQVAPQIAATTPAPASLPSGGTQPGLATPAQQAAAGLAAAAVAVAEVPRRNGERRARAQSQRTGLRSSRTEAPVANAATVSANALAANSSQGAVTQAGSSTLAGTALADTATDTRARNPFRPQPIEGETRAWPRAVLPDYPASGAFTASYGSSQAAAPSFYPFEPRRQSQSDAVDPSTTTPVSSETPTPQP